MVAAVRQQLMTAVVPDGLQSGTGLMQIDQHPTRLFRDGSQSGGNQLMAIAIERLEYVAIHAMRMHAHEHIVLCRRHRRESAQDALRCRDG